MFKEESDKQIVPIPKTMPLTWSIDQSFPNEWIYLNRVFRLAHSPTPEKYAVATLNYLNFSTLTSDFPLSPLFQFDPRDYHRFRFKSETVLLKHLADSVGAKTQLIFVNDVDHAAHILWPEQVNFCNLFPCINVGNVEASKVLDLRTRLVHQGEVPNLSKLFRFWSRHEKVEKTLARFNIDMAALKQFQLHTRYKINCISELLRHPKFLEFLSLSSEKINYLSIFTSAVFNMLSGLQDKKYLSTTDQDSLAIILFYCHKAFLNFKNPLEFTKYIQLIFEEIKLLLSDYPYTLEDFEEQFKKLFPHGKLYYANSGSNALSIVLNALSLQKRQTLKIVNIGCKYYEESLALNYSKHELFSLSEELTSIDVLRIDLKSPANCEKKYVNQNIYSILDFIKKHHLLSPHFSLVIDGTLNPLSDVEVDNLQSYFKLHFPQSNFVYFGSGVKSHCLGIDVATFGWISVANSNAQFSAFNRYLQTQSQRNATDNPDFHYVTHLIRCCAPQLKLYHQQLLANTQHIHSAIKNSVDTVLYEGNEVPYIEIFSPKPLHTLTTRLENSLLRYRGSFGFPYPTWINITNNTERSSIRVSCGILSEELNRRLIDVLKDTFEERLVARM